MSLAYEEGHAPPERTGATFARWRTWLPGPWTLLALVVYVAYAFHMTWPVPAHLGNTVFGAQGDLTGSIALLREMVEGHHNPFAPGTLDAFNAPEGLPIDWRFNLSQWPLLGFMYILALAVGATAAFSIATLLGYVASGLGMFLLVRKLTGNAWAALIVGWAFAFYPFAQVNGQGHNAHVHGWVFVLIVWRALALHEKPTVRNGVLLGLAAILAMAFNPYFLLFAAVLLAVAAVAEWGYAWISGRDRQRFKVMAIACVMGAGYAIVLAGLTLSGGGSGSGAASPLRVHSTEEITIYSARAFEYVVPARGTTLFGDETAPFLASHAHGSNPSESTLYVGVTMLLLALIGVVLGLRRRGARRQWFVLGLAVGITVVAFVFSAPPKAGFGPVQLPAPSEFISHVTSTWRAYSRFVILVMLGVSLLAGFGLAYLSERLGRTGGIVLLAVATVLVPLDLINRDPRIITKLPDQPVFDVLERQPRGIVAQYPLYPLGYGVYSDLFRQGEHGFPMINGYAGTAQEARDLSLADLSQPATVPQLATLGVKYLVVSSISTPAPIVNPGKPPAKDVQVLGSGMLDGLPATVYRVTAKPQPLISAGAGFGGTEGTPPDLGQWLGSPSGEIDVQAVCRSCTGTIQLYFQSLARRRAVAVSDAAGRVVWRGQTYPDRATKAKIPVRYAGGKAKLTVVATPGPEEVPGADPRSLSVRVSGLHNGQDG